ncbi:MAG: hypothetical protein NTW18_00035 [Candidatus Omnitrophica bacterium]|nr:hypothetical protein [Candidatus Omnitrophota bacterium]
MKIVNICVSVLLSISIVITQSGCSMFVPHTQKVSVIASEPDAKIYINGDLIGTGRAETKVLRNKDASVMVKCDGYYPATRMLSTTMSGIGVVDIVFGWIWLVPWLGLLFPGSREIDTPNITVVLDKEKTK